MLACGALLLVGLAAGFRWRSLQFTAPDTATPLTAGEVARRFVWYSSITFAAGIAAGLTIIGGGGRLAMRLLAATSDSAAQGRLTEADEVVGTITVDGTIGFVVFNGIFGGLIGAVLFLMVRRFLPLGPWSGVAFGLALLVIFGATIDPLRAENPDFDIVGPGWLSVVVFTAMAIAFGLAVRGMAARLSGWLPPLTADRRVLLRYAPSFLLAAIAFSVTAILAVACVVVVAVTRWPPAVEAVRSPRWVLVGRALTIVVVVVSLPNFVSNVLDIATG